MSSVRMQTLYAVKAYDKNSAKTLKMLWKNFYIPISVSYLYILHYQYPTLLTFIETWWEES